MVAYTPGFGLPYAQGGDPPCQMDDTLTALDTRLDQLATQWDADIARATNPPLVKVSRSNFPWNPFTGPSNISFDTLETNSGTPTDLTIDATSLYLPAGYWIAGASINIQPNAATAGLFIQANLLGADSIQSDRLAGVQNINDPVTGNTIANYVGPLSLTGALISLPGAPSTVQLNVTPQGSGGPTTFLAYYMDLWAYKVADYP
jgi:hypothetical protein